MTNEPGNSPLTDGSSADRPDETPANLRLRYDRTTIELEPGSRFTFGRAPSCDLCIRPDPMSADDGVSRVAGYFEVNGRWWRLVNSGEEGVLTIHYRNCDKRSLLPGLFSVIDQPEMTIVIDGEVKPYVLAVSYPPEALEVPHRPPPANLKRTRGPVKITEGQRRAVLALFDPMLREPHGNHAPATYQQAAERLRVSRGAVKRRIEEVRARCIKAGFGPLDREGGCEDDNAKRALFDCLINQSRTVKGGERLSKSDLDAEAAGQRRTALGKLAKVLSEPGAPDAESTYRAAAGRFEISEDEIRKHVEAVRRACTRPGISLDRKSVRSVLLAHLVDAGIVDRRDVMPDDGQGDDEDCDDD